jgi:hypothetical protein
VYGHDTIIGASGRASAPYSRPLADVHTLNTSYKLIKLLNLQHRLVKFVSPSIDLQ